MTQRIRTLAWLAVAAQPVFLASWVIAGALQPHFSTLRQDVSELGALHARDPWIVGVGLALLGLSLVALAPGLWRLLPRRRRRAAALAGALFVLAGVTLALTAVLRLDCSVTVDSRCIARDHAGALSWHHYAHEWAGLVCLVAVAATPFALARALWPQPAGVASLVVAVETLAYVGGGWLAYGVADADGVVERVQLGLLQAWVLIIAAAILHATRPAPKLPAPTPLRPRDFFGRAWAGDGELVFWPRPLWRRFPRRFSFTRRSVFLSDEVWIVEDEARIGGAWSYRRRFYCEFPDASRIVVTAGDLPDGGEVLLGEDGYRIAPYRFTYRFGPLRVTVRCFDQATVAPDGTLIDTVRVRWHGLPVAWATARGRLAPDDGGGGTAPPRAELVAG
jgi:hypothetical protein